MHRSKISRFEICVLLLIIFFTPLTPVLAKEVSVVENPAPTGVPVSPEVTNVPSLPVAEPVGSEPKSLDSPVVKEEPLETPEPSAERVSSVSSVEPQQNPSSVEKSTPKQSLPQADQVSGALVYNFAIKVPPGRAGLQPDLSLNYNSQNTDKDSPFGYGWSLNVPSIQRVNKTGTDKLYTDNYFSSSTAGELVQISAGVYGPRVESGDFTSYAFDGTSWTATDKQGTVYKFGTDSSSRQDNPDGSKTSKWMLQEIRDTNNNFIKYEYFKDRGQIYPSVITYTGNGTSDGIFTVSFLRENRTDVVKSYAAAFLSETDFRINEVDIKVSGALTKKYTFGYSAGTNGTRSLLASATETGFDDSGVQTSLPPTQFSYTQATPGFDTQMQQNNNFAPINTTNGVLAGDVNGDGYQDLIQAYEWTTLNYLSNKGVYIFNPSLNKWQLDGSRTIPPGIIIYSNNSYTPHDGGTKIIDVNGDGYQDLIRHNSRRLEPLDPEINTGTGWSQNMNWDPLIDGYTVTDLNGDGLPDYIQSSNARCTSTTEVSLNSGNGYNRTQICPNESGNFKTPERLQDHFFVDLNGDGLPDIVKNTQIYVQSPPSVQFDKKVYLNTGSGWVEDSSINFPSDVILNSRNGNDYIQNVYFADMNQDGLVDILQPYSLYVNNSLVTNVQVFINKGSTWVADSRWYNNQAQLDINNCNCQNSALVFDMNADGSPDILNTGNYPPNVTSVANFNRTTGPTDVLKNITLPAGGQISVAYKPSTQYKNASGNLLNPNLPLVINTVEKITVTDPANSLTSEDKYRYANGLFYFDASRPTDRKFAGFGNITKTDSAGNTTKTYYHQGDATNSVLGEYNDEYWKIGRPYRVEIYGSGGALFSKTINKWDSVDLGNERKFVELANTINYTYDGDQSHRDTAEEYSYDNANGNLLQKIQWGEVSGNDNGSFSDVGSDKYTTNYSYAVNSSAHIFGLPSVTTVTDAAGAKVSEKRYSYDNQALGSVNKGNPTKQETWKSGSAYATTQKDYESTFGLLTSDTDARGKTTNYSYDSYNLYPASITNPLGQATSLTYDYSSGKVKQKTDPNTHVFQYSYDGLDRLTAEKQPDLVNPSTLVTKTSYLYNDTPGSVSVQKSDYVDASTSVNSYTYFDNLGRKIQERKQAENGNYEVKDYAYNNLDLLQKESLPYFGSGSARNAPTGASELYVNYFYDPIYRITTTTDSVGTVTNTYNDWKLMVTDKRGKTKDLYKDAYGNLVQVDEHNSGNTYSTYYFYDYLGNLTKITDALGNIRNFSYDGLGNRLSAEDLHAPQDATFGLWTYVYDDAGNLITRTDAKGQSLHFLYDGLNRRTQQEYVVPTRGRQKFKTISFETTYVYDDCPNGIGRLCTVTNEAVVQSNAYDALGNIVEETKSVGRKNFTTSYTYDWQGNLLALTNPDSSVVKYEYDTGGLVNKVARKESTDAGYTYVVDNFDYSPTEQPTTITYTNGMTTTNTYDAAKLYRLSSKVTTVAAGSHGQDLAYTYDNNGNITQIVDASATNSAKTANYNYDDLNRLVSATITAVPKGETPYSENYNYDAVGNVISKGGQTYTYGGSSGTSYANPHAVTDIDGTTLTYDQNGNMLAKGKSLVNTWDYNNRLTQTVAGTNTDSYTYEASGQRVTLSNTAGITYYPSKYYNLNNSTAQKHIFANGVEVATVSDSGENAQIHFTASDNLGGTGIVTNSSNAQEEVLDYFPYGGIRIDSGSYSDQRKYAGSEFDNNTGLNYMNARYYDSSIGRFVSEDAVFLAVGDRGQIKQLTGQELQTALSDPQNLNAYAYAKNNPILNTDPTGNTVRSSIVNFLRNSADKIDSYTNFGPLPSLGINNMGALASGTLNDVANVIDPNTKPSSKLLASASLGLNFVPGGEDVKVEEVAVKDLVRTEPLRNPGNVKNIVKMMKENLEEVKPIEYYVNEGEKWLFQGHHRLAAAKELGMETIKARELSAGEMWKKYQTLSNKFVDEASKFVNLGK